MKGKLMKGESTILPPLNPSELTGWLKPWLNPMVTKEPNLNPGIREWKIG